MNATTTKPATLTAREVKAYAILGMVEKVNGTTCRVRYSAGWRTFRLQGGVWVAK